MAFTDLGNLGTGGNTNPNQAALTMVASGGNCAVGELVVVVVAVDNRVSGGGDDLAVASVADNAAGTTNVWTKAFQTANNVAAQGGASVSIWWSKLTTALTTTTQITATFTDATTSDAAAMTARHFSLTSGNSVTIESTPGILLHNTALDPGALDVTTSNIECLRIRACGIELGTATNWTPTASWTAFTGAQSATSGTTAEMAARAEFRIFTGTTASSNPTQSSAINANVYVAFREYTPSAYAGPGDVVSGIVAAWGTHAFNAAAVGSPSQTVVRASDSGVQNFSPATTGASDMAGITSFLTSTTGKVSALFDQAGTNDATQATAGNRPSVTLSGPNSVLTTTFTKSASQFLSCGNSNALNSVTGLSIAAWVSHTGPGGSTEFYAVGRDDNTLGRSYAFGRSGDTWQLQQNGGVAVSFVKSIAAGVLQHIAVTGDAATGFKLYINGAQVATGSWYAPNATTGVTTIGKRTYAGFESYWDGTIDDVMYDDRAWSAAEVVAIYDKGNAIFNPSAPVTGTLAGTETQDKAAFTGTVPIEVYPAFAALASGDQVTFNFGASDYAATAPTGYLNWDGTTPGAKTGIVAAVEAPDAATITAAAQWLAALGAVEAADSALIAAGITANAVVAAVEAADSAAFNGSAQWAATLAATELPDAALFAGAVQWTGIVVAVEAADAAAFTGAVRWAATLGAVEAADTALITSGITSTAILTAVEAADVAAISGNVNWLATLAAVEAADAALIDAGIVGSGILTATEAADVAFFAATAFGAGVAGSLTATEAPDVAALTGAVTGVAGTLAAVEAPDVASLAGAVRWTATLGAVEAADAAVFTGTARWLATLVAIENADTAAFVGSLVGTGILTAVEAADSAAFAGSVAGAGVIAALIAVEAPDAAAISGTVRVSGTLAAVEAADSAAFNGGVVVAGTLAAVEAADSAALTATARWAAVLAATELPDACAILANVRTGAVLAATEAPDVAAFTLSASAFGILLATEAPDIARFTSAKINNQPTADLIARQSPVPGFIAQQASTARTELIARN